MKKLTQRLADFYQLEKSEETGDIVSYNTELIKEVHKSGNLSLRKCSDLPDNYDSH